MVLTTFLISTMVSAATPGGNGTEICTIGFDIEEGSSEEAAPKDMVELMGGSYISAEDVTTATNLEEIHPGDFAGAHEIPVFKIRGPVATVEEGWFYTWGPAEFAGFFYDIDDDIGTEGIYLDITGGNVLDEYTGVIYATRAQPKDFDFDEQAGLDSWGQFLTIGFLSDEYFAGYVPGGYIARQSTDINLLRDEHLSKVLIDDGRERTISTEAPIKLAEGYELAIKGIDDFRSIWLELTLNGDVVDSAIVEPSKPGATTADKTYVYKKDLGKTKSIVIIAVNFKNAFRRAGVDLATVDGIWQISETTKDVAKDTKYGRMTITEITTDTIRMNNDGERITLRKGIDIALMGGIRIKTADQDPTPEDPLRFYIYKEIPEPGTYEIRGTVQTVVDGEIWTWSPLDFTGFFYDIDDNIGTEQITLTITRGNVLDEDTGVFYTTETQAKEFDFDAPAGLESWGQFLTIGFLGDEYFAGYIPGGYIARQSTDINLLRDEHLSKVLINDDVVRTLSIGTPLELAENYELVIQAIDYDMGSVYLQLVKGGAVVDSAIVEPSKPGATTADKTYIYRKDLGKTKKVVIIAVNFKNVFRGAGVDLATVDGIWQISETTKDVTEDTKYGRMTIFDVTTDTIWMNNDYERITLGRDRDILLMEDIWIKTADQDATPEDPLRFYIYKPIRI